jgi:phosphinothricin acetyltransferase
MTQSVLQPAAVAFGPLTRRDWPAVRAIYEEGIATGTATFETEAPTWEEWSSDHLSVGRLVAREGGEVVAWAALSPVSGRDCYRGVVDVSIYVASRAARRGFGRALLERLLEETDAAGIWTVQAGVFPDNAASLALHQRCGFRVVGVRERIGCLGREWKDVVLLERRSEVIR